MLQKFRVTYELDGWVYAHRVEASSKYRAKKMFYLEFPKAKIIKVEVDTE